MEQTSTSEKLHTFIEASKAKGAADDFLVNLLREQGWAAKDIYAALGRYYQSLTGLPPKEPEKRPAMLSTTCWPFPPWRPGRSPWAL